MASIQMTRSLILRSLKYHQLISQCLEHLLSWLLSRVILKKLHINNKITDKCWHFSYQLINWINLVFTCFYNFFTFFFVFSVSLTIIFYNCFHLLYNIISFIDCLLKTWLLRFDFDTDFDKIFRLFDLIFNIKNDSGAFLLFDGLSFNSEDS